MRFSISAYWDATKENQPLTVACCQPQIRKRGASTQEKNTSCAALEKQSEILINEYITNIDQPDYKGFA